MSVTVKALQDVLKSTASMDHKRLHCEHVEKAWGEAETEEGFVKAMKTMFDRMVRQKCILFLCFFNFGRSGLTSLQFIQYHVAGFYKLTIPQSPPSHLWDYSICDNARLEFSQFSFQALIQMNGAWKMVSIVWVWTQDHLVMSPLP